MNGTDRSRDHVENDPIAIGLATEADLPAISEIAKQNFSHGKNHENLDAGVLSKFIERNSVESLRSKLLSGRQRFVVARDIAKQRVVGFAALKAIDDTCVLGTRLHVSREHQLSKIATKIACFTLETLLAENRELLYADLSGDTPHIFSKFGFLYVETLVNAAIANTHTHRFVLDLKARGDTARAESVLLRHLSDPGVYTLFLDRYGLVLERLLNRIERMHETGSSPIRQSVLDHVKNGLFLVEGLRHSLEGHLSSPVRWGDVETMWILHDIGEIGMTNDIPSFRKTKVDTLNEDQKAFEILKNINDGALRAPLLDLYARYSRRKSEESIDREVSLCTLVDKLEAATFIGTSGIGKIWRERAGNELFEQILDANALGAFIEPAYAVAQFLQPRGRECLVQRLLDVVATYHDNELISGQFHEERSERIRNRFAPLLP